MKTINTIIILLCSIAALSQSPQSFSYQAVVRDATGNIIASSPVSLRISLLSGSPQGQSIYTETHFTTTNQFGLVAVSIGQGTTTYGVFDTIAWNVGNYYIQTELDATGGANYQLMGTTQILSVPYALYGRDEDYDTINELQTISYDNDSLSISNGNKIDLPIGFIGEVRMIALSMTGADDLAYIKGKGWAICDGTTPESQGISNPSITSTPNMENKFMRMSNNNTSGATGNADHSHNIWGYGYIYPTSSSSGTIQGNGPVVQGFNNSPHHEISIANNTSIVTFYELVFIIKVK